MSSSFKLQKSKGAKNEARSVGVFLALIGVVLGVLVDPLGWLLFVLGMIFFAASFAATE